MLAAGRAWTLRAIADIVKKCLRTFQLSANGWHFAAGHTPELELLGRDAPYLRPSNGRFSIAASNLELQLPVHEGLGARGTPAQIGRPPK